MFNCITYLTEWFSHNFLSLNMTKTYTIIFSRPSSPLYITYPFLLYLQTYESITTIGFTITSHHDYSPHIANYFLYNIRKSRYKLIFAITKCLIYSLVSGRIIYCCSLLCNLPVNLMYKLGRIQHHSIRILYKLNFASIFSITDLMRSLGWHKFRYICIHMILCVTHKAIYRGFPEYLAQSITIYMHILTSPIPTQ